MLLHKWCQILMRTMSPLAVGLICSLLIEVSSSSSSSSFLTHYSPQNYSTHPTVTAEVKFKQHAVNSSFAKNYKFHRTRLSTEPPNSVTRSSSSSRLILENESDKSIGNKSRTISNSSSRPILENEFSKGISNRNRTISTLSSKRVLENEPGKRMSNINRTISTLSSRRVLENAPGKRTGNRNRTISTLSSRRVHENESGKRTGNRNRTISTLSSRRVHENEPGKRTGNKNKTISNLSYRPILENESRKGTSNKNRTIPNLSLSSRFKVSNGSDVNSTIVFFPRYSRAMANFSKSSVQKDHLPIIVSSHRRILLEPKDYKIRSESDTKYLSRRDIPSNFRTFSKPREISQYFTTSKPRKMHLKFREPAPLSKSNKTSSFRKFGILFKTETPVEALSESTAFIKIKIQNTKKNSLISPILPFSKSRYQMPRNLSQNHRRRGRNFDFNKDSITTGEEPSSEIVISQPISTESTKLDLTGNKSGTSELFNYAYFSGRQRESAFTSSPQSSLQESTDTALLPASIFIPFTDFGTSYSVKKANNLTIYEILKPRLKISSDELSKLPNQTSTLSTYDNIMDQNEADIDSASDYSSTPVATILDIKRTQPFVNSMVILPARKDSNYAIEYVMVNRSSSAIVSPLNTNETISDKNKEFGKRNSNNSQLNNSHEQGEKLKFNPETEVHFQEEITESHISLQKDLLRLNLEQNMNANISAPQTGTSTSPSKSSKEHIYTDNSEYRTQLYESDSIRKIKIPVDNTSPKESSILVQKDLLRLKPEDNVDATVAPFYSPEENLYPDDTEYVTQLYESDSIRKPKMSVETTPFKNLKLDSKMFYDYFAKRPIGNVTLQDFPYPEFRPGNMFRYSDIYQKKPILDMVFTRLPSTPVFKMARPSGDFVTEESIITPTTFNSLRTSVRVLSTFYPNRMQDVTMKFGNRVESTTFPTNDKLPEFRNDIDFEDDEYRDAIDPGFTMEKLAYLLIGTCCGLSILCLVVVVIAIKCRRSIVEKRLKAQFRKRMYYHEKMKDMATPWQQQMFDHFMYLHRRPGEISSCSSATDSCNCRCVTWSLGARNLDSTRPLCSTNRSSLYLCGQKKLPFGAASTLRYESMLGRKRTPEPIQQKTESPNTDSSHENDSLDVDSDSREGDGPKQCTCIDYNVWPMVPTNVPRGFFTVCPNVGRRYNVGNCSQHPPVELRTIARDIPPPVTGSNYLDRSEGVVYWSSNEERLI